MGIKQKEENTNGGLHNTLAAGTTVKGDLVTETDFRLDGKIEGNVSCNGKIVIGRKGMSQETSFLQMPKYWEKWKVPYTSVPNLS